MMVVDGGTDRCYDDNRKRGKVWMGMADRNQVAEAVVVSLRESNRVSAEAQNTVADKKVQLKVEGRM
jgi:hypothetical protein